MFATLGVILLVVSFVNSATMFRKCCDNRYTLDDSLNCIKNSTDSNSFVDTLIVDNFNETKVNNTCSNQLKVLTNRNDTSNSTKCQDIFQNGSSIIVLCLESDDPDNYNQCDSVTKNLDFWGASMMVLATICYTIPYIIVIIVYCFLPKGQNQAYERSVISFNVSYIVLNLLIILLGYFELCHIKLTNYIYGIIGLIIVYFTQACVLWLFIICFDMTLVITRFHWRSSSNTEKRNNINKFKRYSAYAWNLSMIPTLIATFTEFTPIVAENSVLKPNFSNFHGQHNVAILVYTISVPILMLLTNTILFIYTSYKMIKIQKDSSILSSNKVKSAKERYMVYVKLYFIMDAPWLSGALSAVFPSLWILKFVRMIQPVLMLIVIIPKQRMTQICDCMKKTFTKKSTSRHIENTETIYRNDAKIIH